MYKRQDVWGRPLVVTSGNLSGEPLCISVEEGLEKLGHVADVFLVHVMRASERNGSFNPGETAMPSLPLPMYLSLIHI